MFAKYYVAALAASFLPILAVATPWGSPTTTEKPPATTTVTVTSTATAPVTQCNTGSINCCQTVEPANSPSSVVLLGLLGIVLTDLDVLVGLTCTPITVGAGGSSGW